MMKKKYIFTERSRQILQEIKNDIHKLNRCSLSDATLSLEECGECIVNEADAYWLINRGLYATWENNCFHMSFLTDTKHLKEIRNERIRLNGGFGISEFDQDNNNDTRALIEAYALEHDGEAFLVGESRDSQYNSKRWFFEKYDPGKLYLNFSFNYIAATPRIAREICRANNNLLNIETCLENMNLDLNFEYLIWC